MLQALDGEIVPSGIPVSYSLSNERLRLDKNVNKGFSPEMISLLVCKNRKKSPPESTHGKSSFWAQIQNGRHYTESNIEMDITFDLSKITGSQPDSVANGVDTSNVQV